MHFFYCIHCAQCRLQRVFNSLWSWLDSLLFTLFIFIIYHLLFIIGSWQAKLKKTTIWWLEVRRIWCLMLWGWWSWLWISVRTYPPLCMTGLTQWNPSDLSVGWQPGLHVGAEQQLYHQIDESAVEDELSSGSWKICQSIYDANRHHRVHYHLLIYHLLCCCNHLGQGKL